MQLQVNQLINKSLENH